MVNFLRHKFPKIISLQLHIDKTDIIRVQLNNSHRDRRHIDPVLVQSILVHLLRIYFSRFKLGICEDFCGFQYLLHTVDILVTGVVDSLLHFFWTLVQNHMVKVGAELKKNSQKLSYDWIIPFYLIAWYPAF